jgi:hypothetical protein
MGKRLFIIALMITLILPVYSKKDSFLRKCRCNETAITGTEKQVVGGESLAKACKKARPSSATSEISFSAPIGQYLTSFE